MPGRWAEVVLKPRLAITQNVGGSYSWTLNVNKTEMKRIKLSLLFLIALSLFNFSFGQNSDRQFGEILQSYYLYKDKDLINKTVDFVNNTNMEYNSLSPILTGFFGALFLSDSIVKTNFISNLNKVEKSDIKELLNTLASSNIDSIYSRAKISTQFNDMNWSSFFATGNTKYLDNIIANIAYSENRSDINLFLSGASAKWSLCSNSKQDKKVKLYLTSLQDSNKTIKDILDKDQQFFREEMISILKQQKAKGIWN